VQMFLSLADADVNSVFCSLFLRICLGVDCIVLVIGLWVRPSTFVPYELRGPYDGYGKFICILLFMQKNNKKMQCILNSILYSV